VILATTADTALFGLSALIGIAGTLGVAYTVFRSSSEQRLREVDQHIINNQNILISQQDSELTRLRGLAEKEKERADNYRSDLTQRAAVDHLADEVRRAENMRREEHEMQIVLLKDVIAQLKGLRGTIQ